MLWTSLAALGGCQIAAVEPTPLLGPAPQLVAVWPFAVAVEPFEPQLLVGADAALHARGYRVLAVAVARQMLAERGLLTPGNGEPADLSRIGMELGVDAVLYLDVREFESSADRFASARWDLGWRLLSTRGHGVLWEHAHHGAWRRADLDTADPLRPLDAEPDIVPIGGDRSRNFRDVADLAANLHRMALAHLPRAVR